MFQLDPRTVIFVNFLYSFVIVVFIVASGYLNRFRIRGFWNWVVGFFFIAMNFLILSLRGVIPVSLVIVLPHLMTVWAYVEIKRGLTRFHQIKNRIYTDLIIIAVFFILLLLNRENARIRNLTLNVCTILVFIDTIALFSGKKVREERGSHFVPYLYGLAAVVMIVRLIIGLSWNPRVNPMNTGNSLSAISILFFITNIVIFFTLFFSVLRRILNDRNRLIDRLQTVSLTDELTGLMNRRGFKDVLNQELKRFQRTDKGFTFAICDIDFFKSVNDIYGHECGDYVLIEISKIFRNNMRDIDTVARWGGEEFVILYPETELDKGIIAFERIRKEMEDHLFIYGEYYFHKTISMGVKFINDPDETLDGILEKADRNLYEAKETGRNKIVGS